MLRIQEYSGMSVYACEKTLIMLICVSPNKFHETTLSMVMVVAFDNHLCILLKLKQEPNYTISIHIYIHIACNANACKFELLT